MTPSANNPTANLPSQAETELLRLLWDKGPRTVHDLHTSIQREKAVGYTTVLKQVQRMEKKGLVVRDGKSGRAVLYRAAAENDTIKHTLAQRVLDTVFGGSVASLVAQAIGDRPISTEEAEKLRSLLDEHEVSASEMKKDTE